MSIRFKVDRPPWHIGHREQYAVYRRKRWFGWEYLLGERYDTFEQAVERAKELRLAASRGAASDTRLPHEV